MRTLALAASSLPALSPKLARSVSAMLAWGAGAMDLATGLGLVALPAWTLARMGVAVPGAEALVFVRFVGAFVGAVGATYLWAAMRPRERLRVVFGATLWLRGAAGTFTGVAVAAGMLERGWVAVTLTDWSLGIVQAWLLGKAAGCEE